MWVDCEWKHLECNSNSILLFFFFFLIFIFILFFHIVLIGDEA
jgi:hypothetical protein